MAKREVKPTEQDTHPPRTDMEKLEAIGRRVNEVNYSITLLVNDIKEILEK